MTRTLGEIEDLFMTSPNTAAATLTEEETELWKAACSFTEAIGTTALEKQSSIHEVLVERGSRYGPFAGHARITQALKQDMQCCPKWISLSASQQEALEMIVHKIGRILNGDPNYLDSWVDIVGYTQLVIDELNAQFKENLK